MNESDLKLFRNNLPKIRAVRGYHSANELSKKCGFKAVKRIADFETAHRGQPSLEEIIVLCRVLAIKIDDLLFKEIELGFVDRKEEGK